MEKSIYKITNLINNKIYIGQSKHPFKRFQEHCNRSENYTSLINYAINKYGKDNFSLEIIENNIEDYNEKEKYWIQYYNCMAPKGYNIQEGGEQPPVFYGEDNILTKHSYEQVALAKYLLKNTDMDKEKIAKESGYKDKSAIDRINTGVIWFDPDETYPLRKDFLGKVSTKERWLKIVDYLENTDLTHKEIGQLCGVGRSTVTAINRGQNGENWGKEYNIDYPIRKR